MSYDDDEESKYPKKTGRTKTVWSDDLGWVEDDEIDHGPAPGHSENCGCLACRSWSRG